MKNKIKKESLLTIIIPTYNSGKYLSECLVHIRKQTYKNIEIIISDGGSSDNTKKIACDNNCRIINNIHTLAEPGISLGMQGAKGDYLTIIAVDNYFYDKSSFEKIVKVLDDNIDIYGVFPKHDNLKKYSIYTKYTNVFTDPFNHYMYGYSSNARTFSKVYGIKRQTKNYILFDFKSNNVKPIIALAQGFCIRKDFINRKRNIWDDIQPVIDLIYDDKNIAYLPNVSLMHDTTRDLKHFVKKQRWAVRDTLLGNGSKLEDRSSNYTKEQKIKMYIYPIYSFSVLLPVLNSLYHLIKDKQVYWLLHPYMVFVSSIAILIEFVIIKLGSEREVSRL